MKKLALILLLTLESFGQTLTGLQTGSGAATGTLASFPLGNFQWSMRFHNLPTTAPASDLILVSMTTYSGLQISCKVQGGTLGVTCYSPNGAPGGAALLPLNGATDIRLVYTRLFTATNACQIGGTTGQNCSQERIDFWKGDCSGYQWSNMPIDYNAAEPATTSQPYQIGGSTFVTDFFRADVYPTGGIAATPTCPADAPTHHAANMDYRFEGNSITDVSGHGYTLTVSGQAFLASPTYNPAAIILTSSTAPRPVVPLAPFTLTSASVTSDSATNAGVPSTFSWSQVSGPSATISNASASSTTITPSADGSYVFQLSVTDGSSHTGTAQVNVGVVNSDANGIKIQTNAELGWIIGPIPRFGTSPWPWFEQTEATDADVLAGYWQAPPSPATLFTGTGNNDAFFSGRGPFLGATSDSYDVMIASTGFPDSYEWRKDGGAWSAPIPISQTGTCYSFLPNPLPVTDGVVICFGSSSGHTLGDKWTRMAPQAGTASVTATGANKLNPSTGEIEGVNTGNPCSYLVTAVGTGTLWKTGSPSQRLTANNNY